MYGVFTSEDAARLAEVQLFEKKVAERNRDPHCEICGYSHHVHDKKWLLSGTGPCKTFKPLIHKDMTNREEIRIEEIESDMLSD